MNSSLFPVFGGNEKARGVMLSSAPLEMGDRNGSGSKWFHGRDQADVRAADSALGSGHAHRRFRGGAAAVLFRAEEADAGTTGNADLLGDRLVAWDLLFNGLDHSAFTALGITAGDNLFGDDVVAASLHLAGFSAVSGSLGDASEHRAAGAETKGDGG